MTADRSMTSEAGSVERTILVKGLWSKTAIDTATENSGNSLGL